MIQLNFPMFVHFFKSQCGVAYKKVKSVSKDARMPGVFQLNPVSFDTFNTEIIALTLKAPL